MAQEPLVAFWQGVPLDNLTPTQLLEAVHYLADENRRLLSRQACPICELTCVHGAARA